CGAGEFCGYDEANQCAGPSCTATTCSALGYECGFAPDGCGGQLNCWQNTNHACPLPGQACIGNPATCKAGSGGGDSCLGSPYCNDIPSCTTQYTKVTGRVTTPDGELGVPNAIVYIPRDPSAVLP